MTSDTAAIRWAVALVAAVAVAVVDCRSRKMPNRITVSLWVVGLAFAAWHGGWPGLGEAFVASVAAALPFVLLFLFGGGGAGDAKFMAALGAWLGLVHGVVVLLAVGIAGLVLAAIKAVLARRLGNALLGSYASGIMLLSWLFGRRRGSTEPGAGMPVACGLTVPYGIAILAGVVMALAFCALYWGSLYETPL